MKKEKPTVSKESINRIVNEMDLSDGYNSPIFVYMRSLDKMQMEIKADFDNNVWKAVIEYGVHVNKEDLLRALAYDRDQYKQGYANGVVVGYQKGLASRWISVDEEMPDGKLPVRCFVLSESGVVGIAFWIGDKWTDNHLDHLPFSVSHWMYIPAPPENEIDEKKETN